jgi:hypothetical protein
MTDLNLRQEPTFGANKSVPVAMEALRDGCPGNARLEGIAIQE